jgi:TPR repeat protein
MAADPSAGREWLQRAADSGDPQAAHLLAGAYLTGAAGFSDSTKAATLYRRASDLGDTGAGLALAGLLARGIGGPIDLPQAEQRVRIAAAGGDPAAMAALGRYLTTSAVKGWSPNFDEAMFWLTRVADKGDLAAMEQLGDIQMFLAKSGPAQDPAKGFAWFKRCADAGRASCHFALGRAYGLALGTSGDLAQAWAHMTLARDAGQSGAQSQLDALDTRLTPAQRSEAVSILSRLKNPAAG